MLNNIKQALKTNLFIADFQDFIEMWSIRDSNSSPLDCQSNDI